MRKIHDLPINPNGTYSFESVNANEEIIVDDIHGIKTDIQILQEQEIIRRKNELGCDIYYSNDLIVSPESGRPKQILIIQFIPKRAVAVEQQVADSNNPPNTSI